MLKKLNSIFNDPYFKMAFLITIIFFSSCISSHIPKQFTKLLDNNIVRLVVLVVIFHLSTIDFDLAVVLTAGYFLSINKPKIENMANDSKENSKKQPDCKWTGNWLNMRCVDQFSKPDSCRINNTKLYPDNCENKCTSYTNDNECNKRTDCFWTMDANNKKSCAKLCNTIIPKDCSNAAFKYNNTNCITKNNKCVVQDCSKYNNDNNLCKKISGCTTLNKDNKTTCVNDCSVYNNNKQNCINIDGCKYENQKCMINTD